MKSTPLFIRSDAFGISSWRLLWTRWNSVNTSKMRCTLLEGAVLLPLPQDRHRRKQHLSDKRRKECRIRWGASQNECGGTHLRRKTDPSLRQAALWRRTQMWSLPPQVGVESEIVSCSPTPLPRFLPFHRGHPTLKMNNPLFRPSSALYPSGIPEYSAISFHRDRFDSHTRCSVHLLLHLKREKAVDLSFLTYPTVGDGAGICTSMQVSINVIDSHWMHSDTLLS